MPNNKQKCGISVNKFKHEITKKLYELGLNNEIALVSEPKKQNLKINNIIKLVQYIGKQQGDPAQIERISAVLRMIHRRATDDQGNAYAEFHSYSGFVSFADIHVSKTKHAFLSKICTNEATNEVIYKKLFTIKTEKDFTKLSELCVGILYILYGHKAGYPLKIDFYIPPSVLIPGCDALPEL